MDNLGGNKKVRHTRRVGGGDFDLELYAVRFAGLEAQAATGNVLAVDDVVAVGKAPNAGLEVGTGSNVFAPVFCARRKSFSRLRQKRRRRIFFDGHGRLGLGARHLNEGGGRFFGSVGATLPERGRTAFLAIADNA